MAKIVLYDVRGIQDFIFRSNKIKEIIGASDLVRDLYKDGLKKVVEEMPELNLDDVDLDCVQDFDVSKKMQVLYIGGGNASVYFSDDNIASEVSKNFSVYVLQSTYSLNLSMAMIEKTDDYSVDYSKLQVVLNENKDRMPYCKPIGAFPLCKIEDSTGLPVYSGGKSSETKAKNEKYSCEKKKYHKEKKYDGDSGYYNEEILDEIVEKGNDSTIAVIHIDGNNIGAYFRKELSGENDYAKAIKKIRETSRYIDSRYQNAFNTIKEKLKNYSESSDKFKEKILIRKILTAGDDITFIVNANFAFELVKDFIEIVEGDGKDNFTACAGIAFCHSHFPFSNAYTVAEELCSNAKKVGKSVADKAENTRSWVDFQLLSNMNAVDLDKYRESQFTFVEGKKTYNLMRRPYVLERNGDDESLKERGFKAFIDTMKSLDDKKKISRSDIKEIRNSYTSGSAKLDLILKRIASRNKIIGKNCFKDGCDRCLFDEKGVAYYYDAYELFDLFIDMGKGESK